MKSVKIGNQEWSTENLNVDHFNNGDEIQEVESAEGWLKCLEGNQKLQTILEEGNIDHFIAAVTYGDDVLWNYKENPSETPFRMEEPDEFWRFE
jgi:hypothetical protein